LNHKQPNTKNMLNITINDSQKFEIIAENEQILVNGQATAWDLVSIAPNHYHIVFGNKSYNAEVVQADFATKTFVFKINGKLCNLAAKNRFDLLLDKLGMSATNSQKVNDLKAPMPGLILQVLVKEGDTVQKGDTLLILEAMKMENVLKAQGDGIIKKVNVKQGDRVEKGFMLIMF
jgi:biotin carboxyl carrier protein